VCVGVVVVIVYCDYCVVVGCYDGKFDVVECFGFVVGVGEYF